MRLVRVLLVGVALVVCAWFALGARQAHDLNAATALVSGSTPPPPARVVSLLRSAATLNPDRQVDVVRGELQTAQRHYAQARHTLLAVIGPEPQNIDAWIAYARASADDRVAFLHALVALKRLDPRL